MSGRKNFACNGANVGYETKRWRKPGVVPGLAFLKDTSQFSGELHGGLAREKKQAA